MNLNNGQITVGEILQNPQARSLVQRELPQLAGLLNSPLAGRFFNMPLNTVLAQSGKYLPAGRVQYLLGCLREV